MTTVPNPVDNAMYRKKQTNEQTNKQTIKLWFKHNIVLNRLSYGIWYAARFESFNCYEMTEPELRLHKVTEFPSISTTFVFNPRPTKPFFVTQFTKGMVTTLLWTWKWTPPSICTMVLQGVSSSHTYQNKYQHPNYVVTVTS